MMRLYARFWKYEGNHEGGHDCERYDPHKFGIQLISAMAYHAEQEYEINGVSLKNVMIEYGKSDGFGREIGVHATAYQWDAMRDFINEGKES